MPTAVESYAKLGAVLIELPAYTGPVVEPASNATPNLGGRNSSETLSSLQHKTGGTSTAPHYVVSNNESNLIGGRSGTGAFISSPNAHLKHPPAHGNQPITREQNTTTAALFQPVESAPIGVRTGGALPSTPSQNAAVAQLKADLPQIATQIKQVIAGGQRLEIFGVATSSGIIAILIGLLRQQGLHASLVSCDGSVRPGFPGPTAVVRAFGTHLVASQFLQQVGAARLGH